VVGHRITGDRRKRSPGIGWEFLHVAIDDHSRIAFSAISGMSAASQRRPFSSLLWNITRVWGSGSSES
jgi:hypothetical protein